LQIRADLVVGCDGRHSLTRVAGELELLEFGVPIDVLWFRIGRKADDPEQVLGVINYGKALILINRGGYFQAGMIIRKGGFDEIKRRGLEEFRNSISQLAPYLNGRVADLTDWEQIKLLTVQINRLRRWYRPGLLCIGDAAHAMSPAGGVGINLAIQDAVASANLLTRPLQDGCAPEAVLAAVQKRREFPTRMTQAAQVRVHKVFARLFDKAGQLQAPWALRIATRTPGVHRALGHAIGVGVRPEHVRGGRRQDARRRTALAVAVGAALGVAGAIVVFALKSRKSRQCRIGGHEPTYRD
jgi:2-polyprenyl-6-methoxyphenol hydroxylase-like FAD-dependent oxidoreductase